MPYVVPVRRHSLAESSIKNIAPGEGKSKGKDHRSLRDLPKVIGDPEKRCRHRALNELGRHKTLAVNVLGIGRASLYRKLKKHGVEREK
jgi:DNA-binding NtrC family response regulator